VLLKAAAGGGGKGMRVCYDDGQVREAWTVAKAESLKFFGDDRLLVEKYVEEPHHIEFQVMCGGDGAGGTDVAVFAERECSIQRRNQKILEESPSCLLRQDVRQAMAEQVRTLCRAVQYESAGTVEWLVEDNGENFYFLEMNTRLQVEHPVTEMVSHNIDLVEAMLHVGAGWGLPDYLKEYAAPGKMVPHSGHAIEARIYAEDPVRGFLPSTGPLVKYVEPTTGPNLRVDSGFTHGQMVSPYYDPMLSKVIGFGRDRGESIRSLQTALEEYVIEGVQHNSRLVQSVLREPDFAAGNTPTSFLPTHYPDGFRGVALTHQEREDFAVAAALIGEARRQLLQQPSLAAAAAAAEGDGSGGTVMVRIGGLFGTAYKVVLQDDRSATVQKWSEGGNYRPLEDTQEECGEVRTVLFNPDPDQPFLQYDPAKFRANVTFDGVERRLQVLKEDVATGELTLQMHGALEKVWLQSPREYELSRHMKPPPVHDTTDLVLSPMPGTLISYAVQPGDTVEEGQELCIVESMKMQNMIRSPREGTVAECKVSVGSSLRVDEVILTFYSDAAEEGAA
jgi:propionyl-CoA carboxylase alpha chain